VEDPLLKFKIIPGSWKKREFEYKFCRCGPESIELNEIGRKVVGKARIASRAYVFGKRMRLK